MSKRTSVIFACLIAVGMAVGCYPLYLQLSGNFHTVIEGQLYRSAQPPPRQLERYVSSHDIKSIINLRASGDKGTWYSAELATAGKLGVEHVDYPMSASQVLTPEQADRLVELMASLPPSGSYLTILAMLVSLVFRQHMPWIRAGKIWKFISG
jgi:hypothetical protein